MYWKSGPTCQRTGPPCCGHVYCSRYLLTAVAQAAVAQQKPRSARGQIGAMSGGQRLTHQRQAEAIVGSAPMGTRDLPAERLHLLHLGKGEGLRVTVGQAPA